MNTTRMNSNTHIQLGYTCHHSDQVYGFNHVKTHLNCTWCMIGTSFGKTRDTIITISKQFYTKTMIISCKTIETNKQFMKSSNNFCWNTLKSVLNYWLVWNFIPEKSQRLILKLTWDANFVKPTMSANNILKYNMKSGYGHGHQYFWDCGRRHGSSMMESTRLIHRTLLQARDTCGIILRARYRFIYGCYINTDIIFFQNAVFSN